MSQSFTWIWHSYGSAQCPGVRCGRVLHRTAWIILGGAQYPVDREDGQYGKVHSSVDSAQADVVVLIESGTFRNINGNHVVQ